MMDGPTPPAPRIGNKFGQEQGLYYASWGHKDVVLYIHI